MTRFDRIKKEVERRYKRKVIAHPKGAVVHDGDCEIYRIGICTCGLIHMLLILDTEQEKKIYPKFMEDYVDHMNNIDDLQEWQREKKEKNDG